MEFAPSISTQSLSRRFGDLIAVDEVNLQVAPGQFFGFLGPNGAGKSTTIKMLTGLLAPSSGKIEILGLDLEQHPVEVKRQIGVVPEGMALFGRLTGSEFLSFAGRMYGLDRQTAAQRAAELLESCDSPISPKSSSLITRTGCRKSSPWQPPSFTGRRFFFSMSRLKASTQSPQALSNPCCNA